MEPAAPAPLILLYCCHRSASIISAAAKSRKIATSPFVSLPPPRVACALPSVINSAFADRNVAPVIPRPFRKERRLKTRGVFEWVSDELDCVWEDPVRGRVLFFMD